jgi:hypothetical protein
MDREDPLTGTIDLAWCVDLLLLVFDNYSPPYTIQTGWTAL